MNWKEWILKQAGQIILLIVQIDFNKQVLNSFETPSPRDTLKLYKKSLVSSINEAASVMSKNLPNYKTMTVEALLTIMVHSRDTLSGLVTNRISKVL
jgi:predicted Zn-dependent protease with MMP-like domain